MRTNHWGCYVAFDVLLEVLLQGEAVVLDVLLQVLGLLQQVLATDAALVVDFRRHRPPVLKIKHISYTNTHNGAMKKVLTKKDLMTEVLQKISPESSSISRPILT